MVLSLAQIAELVQGTLAGDGAIPIHDVAKIEDAQSGELSFIANPKYAKYIDTTRASAVIVSQDFPETKCATIRVANPYFAFLKVLQTFHPPADTVAEGIHPTAVIGENTKIGHGSRIGAYVVIGRDCQLGDGVVIHPGTVIGPEVQIGERTIIYANVVIRERVRIGNRVIIHGGTVIGADGFGFAREGQVYHKIPQVGTVVIEDQVEIGANCTIDRATMGQTVLHKGVKLDNLIQVAHNVEIGENTVIAAQTGISGSTKIGSNAIIGGQVGFVGHIEVGNNATIGAQSGVSKSLAGDAVYFGYPAKPIMQAKREEAALRKLPELLKKIAELEARLAAVEQK